MAAQLYWSFFLSLVGGSLLAASGYRGAIPMRKFTVDLDKPPDERWVEILAAYKSSVPIIVEYFDHQVLSTHSTVHCMLFGRRRVKFASS